MPPRPRLGRRPTEIPREIKDEPAPPAIEPTPEPTAPAPPKRNTINVTLTADDLVDWESMRPSTQERLRKALGGSMPPPTAASGIATPALVRALVGSISSLAAGLAVMTGHTPESSERLKLSEQTTSELVPLWEAAINDYGMFLGRHQNLIVAAAATGLAFMPGIQGLQRAPRPISTNKPH